MVVSRNEVDKIFKTLPIGYYTGRNISAELKDEEISYYVPMDDRIVISYRNIERMLEKIEGNKEYDIERVVRTLLYHEVSHAMLTPRSVTKYAEGLTSRDVQILNIFEDERIERIMDGKFYNVDFKENVRLMNDDPDDDEVDDLNRFFDLVRFRHGPADLLQRVSELIINYRKFSHCNDQYSWESHKEASQYFNDVKKLYDDLRLGYHTSENLDLDKISSTSGQSGDPETGDDGDSESTYESNQREDGSAVRSNEGSDDGSKIEKYGNPGRLSTESRLQNLFDEESQIDLNEILSLCNFAKYYNPEMEARFSKILERNKRVKGHNSSAITSYSGVFNPRLAGNEDYRFFVQQNRQGSYRSYQKMKLNLWIDCSGSFWGSISKVNEIVKALSSISKRNPDFDLSVVAMEEGEKIIDVRNVELEAGGGNRLDNEVFTISRKINDRNAMVRTIVLFDGYAFTDVSPKSRPSYHRNFKVFDNPNVAIISDSSNREAIKKYAPSAKSTYVDDQYTEVLEEKVYEFLQELFRV